MSKNHIINVIEYKTICKNDFSDKESFNLFKQFIEEYEPNDDLDVLKFVKIGYKRGLGETIQFNNYVGLIQFNNGKRVQILPKIANSNDKDDDNYTNTKRILFKMLKCLRWNNFKSLNYANVEVRKMNILEIFIAMYINEVEYLVKTGIKSNYVNRNENLTVFKGKLLVKENILYNHSNKERVYVSFDEFSQDCPENKIIKTTLNKLLNISNDINNRFRLMKLLQQLDSITESTNLEYDFNHITLDRNMKKYENVIEWSKVFLFNKSFSTFSGSSVSKSLLFPMNRVFEDFVAYHIKKEFAKEGWEVKTQVKKEYLFIKPNNKFRLVPDILIAKNGKGIILDTKWKILRNKPKENYGISQADMYQMYAYCKKYNVENNDINHVYVLYPLSEGFESLEVQKFESSDNVKLHIFFIDLSNIEDSILYLQQNIEREINN